MKYRLWADGAVTKNPGGLASYGFLLYGDKKQIDFGYGIIGSGAKVNNVMAECFAISQGLSSFIRFWNQPKSHLTIFSDSKYVVSQLVKDSQKDYFKIVNGQIRQIKNYLPVSIRWIPRNGNKKADVLAKQMRNFRNNLQIA